LNKQFIKRNVFARFQVVHSFFHVNCKFLVIEIHGRFGLIFRDRYYLPPLPTLSNKQIEMIEVLLFGIVLGLIPITLAGLFVTAYLQYRRGDQLDL
jgi:cytochrome b6-f complex subunit 5